MLAKSFYACLFSACVLGPGSVTAPAFAQLPPASAPPAVMMLGDSITEAGPWQALFPKTQLSNRGVSGYTTNDLLREIEATVALRPTKVFLMIGINDLLRRASVEQTFQQYALIVDALQKNKITVVMQATLECSRPRCGSTVDAVRALNLRLQKLAHDRNIRWIDLNRGLATEELGLLPEYTWDGLHLSKPAYLYWAEQLKGLMQ